jgi:ATP-dependent HslUV protease ATP-binding subunit HslU
MTESQDTQDKISTPPQPDSLTPAQIVAELDKHIVGQGRAKRVTAIALRNRTRRRKLPEDLQKEIVPKNIIMIGPTGVGKTEIARRLSDLVDAPFIKVEATKYTEVGYVGRDVESMIRELVESGVRMVQRRRRERVQAEAEQNVITRLVNLLVHEPPRHRRPADRPETEDEYTQMDRLKERMRDAIVRGEFDSHVVDVEVEEGGPKMIEIFSNTGMEEMGVNLQDMLGNMMPKRTKTRSATVAEARKILLNQEVDKLIDMDSVVTEAINLVEQSGIVFLDEIDKIAGKEKSAGSGPDVSREGVQRDILPIVEGSTVVTKHGPVKTDHILFIAAGAFHVSKPSDLIPELQGRFPLRVELDSLTKEDFKRILVEPRSALIKQYRALLAADGVTMEFTDDAIDAVAELATTVNEQTENIGARRLHTILEKVLEDISFDAPDNAPPALTVDAHYVRERVRDIVKDVDLSRYIL